MDQGATKQLILLVDDEADVLAVYRRALVASGFTVVTATNGAEGVQVAKERHPDLIFMDVKMPVMDGIEAFAKLQEDPETKNIRVVFLTAFSDPNRPEIDVRAAKDVGAHDFIKKGISLEKFIELTRSYLRNGS